MEIQMWKEILNPYELAVEELQVKFNHMVKEYRQAGIYSPIEQVLGRVKSISSILLKAQKHNIDLNEIEGHILDIAGIRLICQFTDDIYNVADLIRARSDMEVITEKDYVKNIKESGYRSYHIIVQYKVETVKVNMGTPILLPKYVPVVSDKDKVVDEPIVIDDKEYRITCVSMGNPHAITFIENTDDLEIETIGPKFENNPIFPDRVNTEFIQVLDRNTVKMRVWERGSGETFACGTGACATVVACVLNGLTDDKVTVKLLGGDLFIEYNREENTVYMTGPAKVSFTGKIEV